MQNMTFLVFIGNHIRLYNNYFPYLYYEWMLIYDRYVLYMYVLFICCL
jgi:hypothetical protein